MCDFFDMACRDASNALQLNIKVNSENLLPKPQKYNVGSLRIPADPSWPKIPQRKLAEDMDDVIEPPCVVTLTGTPRKSRTTVRLTNSQQSSTLFTKDHVPASLHPNIYQKISHVGHPLKRRPGCADPRFKKVTTVKSQMTSTEPPDRERNNYTELSRSAVIIPNQIQSPSDDIRKTIPEKDNEPPKITQQEAEKPGELRGLDGVGVQTIVTEDFPLVSPRKNFSIESTPVPKEVEELKETTEAVDRANRSDSQEEPIDKKEEILHGVLSPDEGKRRVEPEVPKKNDNEEATPLSMGSPTVEGPCLQCCQVQNAGQILLVVENKTQGGPLGTLQIDTSSVSSCQYTTQCYNVQVPVLSYQNLPLQISTQQSPKGDIPSQLSLGPVLAIPSSASLNNQHHHHHHHHHHQRHLLDASKANFSQISEVPESSVSKETSGSDAPITQPEDKLPRDFCAAQRSRKMLATPPVKLERKQETSFGSDADKLRSDGISESFKAPRAHQLMSDTTDSEAYGLDVKLLDSSGPRICSKESVSGSDYEAQRFPRDSSQTRKKRRNYCSSPASRDVVYKRTSGSGSHPDPESSMDDKEPMKIDLKISKNHRKMKSEQNLPRSSLLSKNYKNISDPHISCREAYGRKEAKRNEERREDIHTDLTTDDPDSENLPDCCHTIRTDLSNVEETKVISMSTNAETSDIPVKTQQLLNKSYMEYYDKLRSTNYPYCATQQRFSCQLAMTTPKLRKRRSEVTSDVTNIIAEEKDPKITMENLSALSNIINRNLNPALRNASDMMQTKQLYVNENMKGSSDPIAIAESALVAQNLGMGNSADLYESSAASSALLNKLKRKREKPVERRLLKLKTIAFFGFMMYAMIVFLPMMYTYFLYDDYEGYEDLSYIELFLDYVVSSFREAFGGFFDLIREIFFRPVSLD